MFNGNIISVDTPDNHSIFMDLFRNELETMLNTLLLAELTEFLSYDKYDVSGYNTGNSRNGYYERSLHTIFGNITIKIPRDRLGQFQNKLLAPYNRNFGNLEEMIIQLYQKGITTREIADIIEKMYGCYYSPQTISNMTKVVAEEVDAFHNRPLPSQFAVVYLDATFITVKRGTAQKEALHVLIGITPSGEKHVVDYGIYPNESTLAYKELLDHAKQRGLEDILLFVGDGFQGLQQACQEIYPRARFQRCWVHITRMVRMLIRKHDIAPVLAQLKLVYTANTTQVAEAALSNFLETWSSKYPKITNTLSDITDLFTFLEFPESIRPSIYSNNLIEGWNKHLKRRISHKEQFPSIESLDTFVCTFASEYNAKFFGKIHRGFGAAFSQLQNMFGN